MIPGHSKAAVKQHANEVKRTLADCAVFGKMPSFQPRGPMPVRDTAGMGLAVEMVYCSCVTKGRINKEGFIQWESLRKKRSTFSWVYDLSPAGIAKMSLFPCGVNKV